MSKGNVSDVLTQRLKQNRTLKHPVPALLLCYVRHTDGGVRQDLPVAGPSPVTVSVVTRRPAGARGAEARHWIPALVVRRGRSADSWLEEELPDTVDFHE